MSSVSKTFSEAAALVPLSLTADWEEDLPPGFFSSLLVSWAQNVYTLAMDCRILDLPGHADFLTGATGLQNVTVHCASASASAAICSLLSSSPTIVSMTWLGPYMPRTFPAALQRLRIDCSDCAHQAQQLILALSQCAVQLQSLEMGAGLSSLASPIALPMLQEIDVIIVLGQSSQQSADFSWLRTQPCMHLWLKVTILPHSTAQQAQAVREIQQLQVAKLSLEFLSAFSPAEQMIWQPLSTCKHISITIRDPASSALELQALPRCRRLEIGAIAYAHREVLIHWAAVAHWDSHVCKNLYAEDSSCLPYVLKYLGCPASDAARPKWVVWADSQVQVAGTPTTRQKAVRLRHKPLKHHTPSQWGWMLSFRCQLG